MQVDNLPPAITETVTDSLIETMNNALPNYLEEHMTPVRHFAYQQALLMPDMLVLSMTGNVRQTNGDAWPNPSQTGG